MFDQKCLQALVAVAEEGGFERAARRLHLTQSAVSQRIRQLEEALGRPVLARTQPPRPTQTGQALLRHARRMGLLEAEMLAELGAEQGADVGTKAGDSGTTPGKCAPWQTLALAVNADSLATWFTGAVLPLLAAPGLGTNAGTRLTLDLRVDDQERTHDMLRRGEVAGCVSTRPTPMQGCGVVFLGTMRYHCAASPAFAARWFPQGLTARAAALAPAVVFNRDDTVHDRYLAQTLGHSPEAAPRHHVPNSERFVDFVSAGAGYGLVPHLQAQALLAAGALVDLLPHAPMPVPLYWHCWSIPSALLTQLTTALQNAARRDLLPE